VPDNETVPADGARKLAGRLRGHGSRARRAAARHPELSMTLMRASTPSIPVSWGELIDKITVVEIKRERIVAKEAAQNVEKELDLLRSIAEPVLAMSNVAGIKSRLDAINRYLWDVENSLREKE